MEAESEEEGYTLTSFRPLSPEDEKSGLRKFIAEIKSKTFNRTLSKDSSHDSQTVVENAGESDTQVSYRRKDVKRKDQLRKKALVNRDLHLKGRKSHGNAQLQSSSFREVVRNAHTRTPSSVLRRLSQLVLLERSNPQVSEPKFSLKIVILKSISHKFTVDFRPWTRNLNSWACSS